MLKYKGIIMKKILLINALLSLGITSLVANATLDEMYKEMRDIANNQVQEKESTPITKEMATPSTFLTIEKIEPMPQLVEIKKIEPQQTEIKKAEIKKIEVKKVEVKTVNVEKAESPKVETKKSATVRVESKIPVVPAVITIPKPVVLKELSTANVPDVHISIPAIPKVPKVIGVDSKMHNAIDRSIKFSKRIPPGYTGPRFGKKDIVVKPVVKEVKIGEVNAGKISAYLRGEILEVGEVEKRLKDAGFSILGSVKLDKKGKLVSVVFTNKELIAMASKPNRGFASTLRILINQKEKKISVTNPLYLLKGFLQDDFDKEMATKILTAITSKFDKLENSGDQLKFQLLPKYQFMSGLPYYKDSIVVATGDNLVEKLKDNKRVFFEQKLDNGSIIVGIALNKRTNGFLKKIGAKNAAMLPLLVLIEGGKAMILDPKYYISIMYPRLTMSEFMKIATIPDAMVKDSKRVFR
jgi:hypothetical protein